MTAVSVGTIEYVTLGYPPRCTVQQLTKGLRWSGNVSSANIKEISKYQEISKNISKYQPQEISKNKHCMKLLIQWLVKGRRPNIGIGSRQCRSIGSRFFLIPFQSVPILSVPTQTESATGQTSSSGQLQTSSILDLYLSAFIKGL